MWRTEDILKQYSSVPTEQPILYSHIFEKFLKKYGSMQGISEWAFLENAGNGFPEIKKSIVGVLIYKKWNSGYNFIAVENKFKQMAHSVIAL